MDCADFASRSAAWQRTAPRARAFAGTVVSLSARSGAGLRGSDRGCTNMIRTILHRAAADTDALNDFE